MDEPANNLHIHPQRKILNSLQTLSSIKGNKVIYSTHSPYLINDDNLDHLFTVRNEANDFEAPRIVCERFLELTTSTEETVRAVEPIVQKTWITHLGTGADWIIKKFNGVAANARKVNHIADCVKHIIGG
ncbi:MULTISPECIES: AAA family ATPase [unclassified Bartonella]|uniref:AAA family ATPase n=1 Tax=unclassified Bartonella TaxID=2645622 RepID=UPI0035CF6555